MAQNSIPATAHADRARQAAYLAARYRIELDGRWWPLTVGQPAPAVLARSVPAACWSLLTAYNPQSVVRPAALNAAADLALCAALEATGLPLLRAAASAAGGGWEEPGWLVGGLAAGDADALARHHGQAGILHWCVGAPVRLRMYGHAPTGAGRHPWVDWAGR